MKKIVLALLSTVVIGSTFIPSYTNAKSDPETKKYKNCKELNKDYKGGVAQTSKTKNKGGKTKYSPHVSKKLYDANKKLDRDKDGIACER